KSDEALRGQLLSVQERFYRYCRLINYQLTRGESLAEADPQGSGQAAQLQQLQAANQQLAQARRFETIRLQAQKQAEAAPLPAATDTAGRRGSGDEDLLTEQGTPTYWRMEAGTPVPVLELEAVQVQQTRQALGLSGLLLGLLLLAWILPYL